MKKDNRNPFFGQLRSRLSNNKGFIRICRSPDGDGGGGGDAGGDAGGDGGDGGGTATLQPEAWREHIDVERREHPSMQNFKSIDDLANGYLNAQKMVGADKIVLPSKEATIDSEEFGQVFDKLGRPSDPASYEIPKVEVPQGAPQASEEQVTAFKELAHKIGLLPSQVAALYEFNATGAANAHVQSQQAQAEEFQKAETALRGKLGKSYDANMAKAQGLIGKFGGEEVAKAIGDSGLGRNPNFIEFMINVAKNFGEDGELLGEPISSGIMSPAEADKEIKKIQGDPNHPWHKKDHPEHEDAMTYMSSLFAMAHPEQK